MLYVPAYYRPNIFKFIEPLHCSTDKTLLKLSVFKRSTKVRKNHFKVDV